MWQKLNSFISGVINIALTKRFRAKSTNRIWSYGPLQTNSNRPFFASV